MGCACKGTQNVDYQIKFKGGEPSVTVSSLREVRTLLAKSSRGGTYSAVPKSK